MPVLDRVDLFIEQWRRERPTLDASGLAVVSRILMLFKMLEQSADDALADFGLALWQFDVLAALRRSGSPFRLTPTELSKLVTLSSGAMTNRIDRLEALGLVARERDPDDRRGILIALTPKGRRLVDHAAERRLADAKEQISVLTTKERRVLASLLRKLMLAANLDHHAGT